MYADLYKDGIFIPPSIEYHYDWRFNFPGPCSNQNWVPWTIATGYGKYYGMPDGLIGQTYSAKVTITGIDPDGLPFQVTSSTICLGKEGIPQQVDLFLKNQSGGDITSENFIYHYTDPDWRSLIVPNTNSVWLSLDEYEFLWTNNSLYGEPVQKYHHWNNDETNILNYSANLIDEQTDQISSHLDFTYPATIKMNLAGHENGKIRFKDPWIADGDVIGEFIRNRGNEAVWHGYNSPLAIQATEEDLIRGVFLEQSGPPFWNPPFYSVRVPEDTIIPFHNQNITWYFQNWGGTDVQFQSPNNPQSAVVFQQANAVAEAKFKGHLVTNNAAASINNNGRRMAVDDNGTIHMVYEDDGDIWYTSSTNEGDNWNAEIRLSDGQGYSKNPSIAIGDLNKYHVVWFENIPQFGTIMYKKEGESSTVLGGTSKTEVRPVITAGSLNDFVMAAWNDGAHLVHTVYTDEASHWSSASTVPGTNAFSVYPTICNDGSSSYATHLAWQNDNNRVMKAV
jgi:hypothetical protein